MRKITAEEWREFNEMLEILIQAKNEDPKEDNFWRDLKKYYDSEEVRKGVNESINIFDSPISSGAIEISPLVGEYIDSQRWFRALIVNEIIMTMGTNKTLKIVKDLIKNPEQMMTGIGDLRTTLFSKIGVETMDVLYPKMAKALTDLLKWWLDEINVKYSLSTPVDEEELGIEIFIAKYVSGKKLESILGDTLRKGGLFS